MKVSIQTASILTAETYTTGLKGGDSGHGGFTVIRFNSTDTMNVNGKETYIAEIRVSGDSEMINIALAMKVLGNDLLKKLNINEDEQSNLITYETN